MGLYFEPYRKHKRHSLPGVPVLLATLTLLWLTAAVCRGMLGNVVPWPAEQALRLWPANPVAPRFSVKASLEAVPHGWLETLAAPLLLAGEYIQELVAYGGWHWIIPGLLLWPAVWHAVAWNRAAWRPRTGVIVLLTAQLLVASYYATSFRSPARRITTPFGVFGPHTHTTRSNGLLTPHQQINWHRARGFTAMIFTDSNRVMSEAELAALRRANPDMLLLNGSEYHGRTHLVLAGLKQPITPREYDPAAAVREARRQGALVVAAHPWYPDQLTTTTLARWGVDGIEAWNGIIGEGGLARYARNQKLILTAATDTLSKSGSRCFTWTLLPRGMDDPDDVLRALRMRKTAVAVALPPQADEEAYQDYRRLIKSWQGPIVAGTAAWRRLTPAQGWCALLGVLALAVGWWWWATLPGGPSPLRELRLASSKWYPVALAGASLLTVVSGLQAFGPGLPGLPETWQASFEPLHALLLWLGLDVVLWWSLD